MSLVQFDPNKIYMLGEENSGLEARGTLQNYEELKSTHLQNGTLFEDPQFVPNEIALGNIENPNEVEWLRPKEIRPKPKFISEGQDRFDVNQSVVGNSWFAAAVADVTQKPKVLEKVVPSNQSFDHEYAGIFHFRFWQYGRWIDIVVDDRLPARVSEKRSCRFSGRLVYSKSTDENEFWTALLEKAYAKLYGSYKHLIQGYASEALADLSGGLPEYHKAGKEDWNDDLYDKMLESKINDSFMACAILHTNTLAAEKGLMDAHVYSITEVYVLCSTTGDVKLLRLRDPLGSKEWTGNWSDKSEQWNTVTQDIKDELFLKIRSDGEFWMEFKDFLEFFEILEMCHPNPDLETNHWNSCMLEGTWTAKEGNPQYKLTLEGENNSMHTVIVGLMQKHRRVHLQTPLPIAFQILTLEGKVEYCQPPQYFTQVSGYVQLLNGTYVLVPFVLRLGESNCDYFIRVYSTAPFNLQ